MPLPHTGSWQARGAEALVAAKCPAALAAIEALLGVNSEQKSSSPIQNSTQTESWAPAISQGQFAPDAWMDRLPEARATLVTPPSVPARSVYWYPPVPGSAAQLATGRRMSEVRPALAPVPRTSSEVESTVGSWAMMSTCWPLVA